MCGVRARPARGIAQWASATILLPIVPRQGIRRRRDQGRLSAVTLPAVLGARQATSLVDVAIDIADTEGIAAVTLRSVALRMGLPLSMLQREAGSRDRLVAMMAQRILSRSPAMPVDVTEPVDRLTRMAEREWDAYRAHPCLVSVLASTRPPLVPAVLDASCAVIEAFMAMGLNAAAAHDRYLALSAYIQGMGLLLAAEHQELARNGQSYRSWWAEESQRLDRAGSTLRRPWLVDLADQYVDDGLNTNTCFSDGLHCIIRGLLPPATA